jgi:iron(III) transport system ATP-binding protein
MNSDMTITQTGQLLALSGISKSYGKITVLRDIDLSIADGEFVCFLGPSGCGKSTLLRIIAGLETQTSGRLNKKGQDITHMPAALRDVGILFQSYALFPNLSVHDNVAYGLVNRRMKRADINVRVDELLALVGLPGTGAKLPGQLSGGQQQRIALARALAPSPRVLLLDEPLSALDAKVRVHLRQQIKELQTELKLTTIMVTHDQEEALTMADRIVVMNHGVIEQIGTPTQIYHQPSSQFVADFVGKMNFFEARSVGQQRVQVGSSILAIKAPELVSGASVTVGIRPEDVCFRSVAEGDENSIRGQVEEVEFLGSLWRAVLNFPEFGDQLITIDFPSDEVRRLGLTTGQEILIALKAEHLHLFPGKPIGGGL